MRTSGSPIVTEAKDFSVCLLDRRRSSSSPSPAGSASTSPPPCSASAPCSSAPPVAEIARRRRLRSATTRTPRGAIHQGDVGIVMPYFPRASCSAGATSTSTCSTSAARRSPASPPRRTTASPRRSLFPGVRFAREEADRPRVGGVHRQQRAPARPGPQRHPQHDRRAATSAAAPARALYAEAGVERYRALQRDHQGALREGDARADREAPGRHLLERGLDRVRRPRARGRTTTSNAPSSSTAMR